MLLSPSSLKDKTTEVGLASPGATHFFLVRWCFPGCPTNFMPFGTEIFTCTCKNLRGSFMVDFICETSPAVQNDSTRTKQRKHCRKHLWRDCFLKEVLSKQTTSSQQLSDCEGNAVAQSELSHPLPYIFQYLDF